MKAYIYHIINKENGKRYIGQTLDIEERLLQHFSELRKNKHHSLKLQRAYNQYGYNSFSVEFDIYTIKDEQELDKLEMKKIEEYDSYHNGYNCTIGGGGVRRKFSYSQYVLLYNLLQNYTGIDRLLGRYFKTDGATFNHIRNNHALFAGEEYNKEEYNKLVRDLQLTDANLIENYKKHNDRKLDAEKCFAILAVIRKEEKCEKTMCEIFDVTSKLVWRLKRKEIYQEYIEKFEKLTEEEKEEIYQYTMFRYDVNGVKARRKRRGTKDQLTQEQVNYIMDNKDNYTRRAIAKTLGVSADRVSSVILGKSYKDLVENYWRG